MVAQSPAPRSSPSQAVRADVSAHRDKPPVRVHFDTAPAPELILEFLTHPKLYAMMRTDATPRPEFLAWPKNTDGRHIVAYLERHPVGLFVLVDRRPLAELHFCFFPEVWGERARAIFQEFLNWIWSLPMNYTMVYGPVRAGNRLAVRFLREFGCEAFSRRRATVVRNNELDDEILFRLGRPA